MFDVGDRIKTLRINRGIKGVTVALEAGFTTPFLYGIESGSKKCSIDNLEKICASLGVTLSEFFADDKPALSPEILKLVKVAEKLPPEELEALTVFLKLRVENTCDFKAKHGEISYND